MVAMYDDVFFHAVKLNRLKNLSHKSFLKPGIGVHCATIFDQKYRQSGSKAAKAQKVFYVRFTKVLDDLIQIQLK